MRICCGLVLLALSGCQCDEGLDPVVYPGEIAGRVCDPGEAVGIGYARVFVEVPRADGSTQEVETVTDAQGAFVLEDVPPGTYTLRVQAGSFTSALDGVEVKEEERTEIEDADCLKPDTIAMTVYDGHDSVEQVLARLGYTDVLVVDTHHESGEHDENTPSWLVEAFGVYDDFSSNDILFINCGPHEWAVDNADPGDLETVLTNLRRFVEDGGSLYLSDWAYDLFELLYPDAVDWYGDDDVRNDAERGVAQDFLAFVQDEELASLIGNGQAFLKYDFSRIALPQELGGGANPLMTASIQYEDDDGNVLTLDDVPVLLEFLPVALVDDPGRIIYTTFHNGANNTRDMDETLRAIIFSL